MRYAPAALALSLLVAVSASVGHAADAAPLDPRAAALLAQGRGQLDHGNVDAATDAFEAALALNPGAVPIYLSLGDAARKAGLQGKAIHYYRDALTIEPQNLAALAGEGGALAEKGAVDKAKRNLAQLQGLCGNGCAEVAQLNAAINKGPLPRLVSADAVKPAPKIETN